MKWINVKDKLPELEEYGFVECFIYTHSGGSYKGQFNTKTQMFLDMYFSNITIVTHWMPIIKP